MKNKKNRLVIELDGGTERAVVGLKKLGITPSQAVREEIKERILKAQKAKKPKKISRRVGV